MKIKRQKEFTSDVLRAIDYRLDVARRRRKAALYKGIAIIILTLSVLAFGRQMVTTSEPAIITQPSENFGLIKQEDGSWLVVNY